MASAEHIVTARLELKPLRAEDFDVFYSSLVADAEVMRFYHSYRDLPDGKERRAKARRDFFDHFDEGRTSHGYVPWGLWSRTDGSFAGWCAVTTPALPDAAMGPELQYMVKAQQHGAGFAGESARAVVADAFRRHGLNSMQVVADAPNQRSRRVAERLGFQFRGPVAVYGSSDMVLYTLDLDEWNGRHRVIAETNRLRVRHLVLEDAAFILELVNDPAWLRFIGDRGVRNLADARGYLEKAPLQMYTQLGYGLYMVELKDSQEPVGMCGLLRRDYLPDADIGFAFLPAHVGKGFAHESARAVMAYGRQQHGVQRLYAIVNPENLPSIGLLRKLGFAEAGKVRPPGEDREINLYCAALG